MKSLCIKQPFATLVCEGVKTVEVRSWRTDYRGELLICASSAPSNYFWRDEVDDVNRLLPAGCIIGIVNLVDVRKMQESDADAALCAFDEKAYSWIIEPVTFCRPDKIVGRLNLFNVPDEKIVKLVEPDWMFNYSSPQGDIKFTKSCPVF